MDRKSMINLVPEDQRAGVETWLDSEADTARTAGSNAASFDRRKSDKAIAALTKERDALTVKVDEFSTTAGDTAGALAKIKDLEKSHNAITAERDALLPIVTKHRAGLLKSAVITAAKLKDPMIASSLIGDLGLTLGDDDTLTEEHAKTLTDWAADPANAGRVTDGKAAPVFPTAGPLGGGNGAAVPDPLKAWMGRLPESERTAVEKVYKD